MMWNGLKSETNVEQLEKPSPNVQRKWLPENGCALEEAANLGWWELKNTAHGCVEFVTKEIENQEIHTPLFYLECSGQGKNQEIHVE
ncbi:hypothetical protein Tco_0254215 [Tanacetum coccineum]